MSEEKLYAVKNDEGKYWGYLHIINAYGNSYTVVIAHCGLQDCEKEEVTDDGEVRDETRD
ncbi:hypothetical protein FAM6161_02963 [Lacticaseibacillus paracasei]|uniref:hypothetical protein n=1 Tax=Lacticaseibacillus paracasei TaxID=1597 RepID=UPI000F0BD749|nr:hypothetical protein [Lacticaseibacillus paracasei]RNE24866.1 hypothetical protein FAM6161_02963 [Lacticaseibacillus paracasei]